MAHSCVSTSASALRFNSSSSPISSSSSSQPQNLSLPFSPLRPRKSISRISRIQLNSPPKAFYSSNGFSATPNSTPQQGIWSIRNDLEIPYSPSYIKGAGPPPMVQEGISNIFARLLQHRIVRCSGGVDNEMANVIVAQLLYLDAMDPNKDIIMYINSPGGSVTAGMAIFDTMNHIRPDVSTVCAGLAASMGAFLLSGGTKGKRFSFPSSRIMIHQPLGGAQGSTADIEVQGDEMQHHKANLAGHLARQTGQDLQKIHEDTDRDFFMSAKEAKAYGLIDDIILNPLKGFPAYRP